MNTTILKLTDEELKDLFTITLHFDVRDAEGNDKHSIPLDQFVKTAQAVQMIINDFNRVWFDGKLPIELHMPALEEASFITKVRTWLKDNNDIAAGLAIGGLLFDKPITYFFDNVAKGAKLDLKIQKITALSLENLNN